MAVTRNFHYLSQFYLGGFTDTGRDDGALHVYDIVNDKQFVSHPGDAGCERDLYLLDTGDDPQALEKMWTRFEEGGAEAIRYLNTTNTLPDANSEMFANLMVFIALTSVRVPAAIKAANDPWEQVFKLVLQTAFNSPESHAQVIENLRQAGYDVNDVPHEKMHQHVHREDFKVTVRQGFKMQSIIYMLQSLAPLLAEREWSILNVRNGGPLFVCSDRPLTVCPLAGGPPAFTPGFGMIGTLAVFPVTKSLALLGMFEGSRPTTVATDDELTEINRMTRRFASRFIYSTTSSGANSG